MHHFDAYLPDPPQGLGYADFRAARARFLARVREQSEICRLERVFSMPTAEAHAGTAGSGRRIADRLPANRPADDRAAEP